MTTLQPRSPKWALLTVKEIVLRELLGRIGPDTLLLAMPTALPYWNREALRTISHSLSGRLVFVTDLRPHGLFLYLIFRYGVSARPTVSIEHQFGGIDDAIIAISRAGFRTGWSLERVCVPMTRGETRAFKQLDDLFDLPAMLGSAAHALLRGGLSLHLDALMNPAIVSETHYGRLVSHWRRLARRVRGT